jgi:hypothetical protein
LLRNGADLVDLAKKYDLTNHDKPRAPYGIQVAELVSCNCSFSAIIGTYRKLVCVDLPMSAA